MPFPLNKQNPYNLIDYYEEYIYYKKNSKIFNETFTSFHHYITSHKKHIKNSIIYLNHIRNESRKYHKLYN